MRNNRELFIHERYFRKAENPPDSGPVNIAAYPGDWFEMRPFYHQSQYVVPGLQLTIAGPNLFANFHRFSESSGRIRIEKIVTDGMGISYDWLSENREILETSRDWNSGFFEGTRVRNRLTETGSPYYDGEVMAAIFPEKRTLANMYSMGPPALLNNDTISWESGSIALRGSKVISAAWQIDDAVNKHLLGKQRYRVDINYLRRNPPLNKTYCLTHYTGGIEPALPQELPPPAPLASLGNPILNVFRNQSRNLEGLDIQADSVKLIIYFDVKVDGLLNPQHIEDLLRDPPVVLKAAVYSRFYESLPPDGSYDPEYGRRRGGIYYCLRDFLENGNEIKRASIKNGYNGDDIIFIDLPITAVLFQDKLDCLRIIYESDDPKLSLLEVKARDARVIFHEGEES